MSSSDVDIVVGPARGGGRKKGRTGQGGRGWRRQEKEEARKRAAKAHNGVCFAWLCGGARWGQLEATADGQDLLAILERRRARAGLPKLTDVAAEEPSTQGRSLRLAGLVAFESFRFGPELDAWLGSGQADDEAVATLMAREAVSRALALQPLATKRAPAHMPIVAGAVLREPLSIAWHEDWDLQSSASVERATAAINEALQGRTAPFARVWARSGPGGSLEQGPVPASLPELLRGWQEQWGVHNRSRRPRLLPKRIFEDREPAVEEDVLRSLRKVRPQRTLEILDSVVRAEQLVSIQHLFVYRGFSFKAGPESWSSF